MPRFEELAPPDFETAITSPGSPFLLDVRDARAYEAGHVPGSRWIPVHDLARRRRELPTSRITRILVVGDTPRRAQAAAAWLALVGFADVAVLAGGFPAWTGAVEKGPPPRPPRSGPELRVIPSE